MHRAGHALKSFGLRAVRVRVPPRVSRRVGCNDATESSVHRVGVLQWQHPPGFRERQGRDTRGSGATETGVRVIGRLHSGTRTTWHRTCSCHEHDPAVIVAPSPYQSWRVGYAKILVVRYPGCGGRGIACISSRSGARRPRSPAPSSRSPGRSPGSAGSRPRPARAPLGPPGSSARSP
jgi:hypothetical protein